MLRLEVRLNDRGDVWQINDGSGWREWTDNWQAFIRERIANTCTFNARTGAPAIFGEDTWSRALRAFFHTHHADPFMEWLEALPAWDGVERLESMFIEALLADDTPLNRQAALRWMIAAVARTFQPACKHDWLPVLIGTQGGGKSTFTGGLFPALYRYEWFVEGATLEQNAKDTLDRLLTACIVEFGELAGMSNVPLDRLKSFLSSPSDRVRLSYDRRAQSRPRCWVGIGTTNDSGGAVLPNDPTGNRRFIAIKVHAGEGNQPHVVAYCDANREQLWAEALDKYRQGYAWNIPSHLLPDWQKANEANTQRDELMEAELVRIMDEHGPDQRGYSTSEISSMMKEEYRPNIRSKTDVPRLNAALTKLGWTYQQQNRRKVWFAPGMAETMDLEYDF